MKKLLLSIALLTISTTITAQMGINTTTPEGALDIVSNTSGLVVPRLANVDVVTAPVNGMIVYDIFNKCIRAYEDGAWSECLNGRAAVRVPATTLPLPNNIKLGSVSDNYIASVYDVDYNPYTTPTGPATFDTGIAADGANEAAVIDVQGTLTTTGLSIKIPYRVTGGSVSLPSFSQTINVPASSTQDGIARVVTFSYPEGSYAVGSGTVIANMKSVGGNLNIKKLDIQSGIGNDNLGVLLANFTYATDSEGGTARFALRAIAGIPDRNFADAKHNFLYLPITGEDGKTWLNHNLGAAYTKVGGPNFSPATKATASNDYKAYGSLYQWGRYSDGHELRDYANGSASTLSEVVNYVSPTSTVAPPNDVKNLANSQNWYSATAPGAVAADSLWQGELGINNPCPNGFRLPTEAEIITLINTGYTDYTNASSRALGLTAPGYRNSGQNYASAQGSFGYYWSSTSAGGVNKSTMFFGTNANFTINSSSIPLGLSVRCIKD